MKSKTSTPTFTKENKLNGYIEKFRGWFSWVKYVRGQFSFSELQCSQWEDIANKIWLISPPCEKVKLCILITIKTTFGTYRILLQINRRT